MKSTTAIPTGGYLAVADFNHDGKMDFATSGNLLALGNGDGTFQTPVTFVSDPPWDGFNFIATGDLNNDGWPDLVLTNTSNDFIYVLINNQQGGFTQTVITAAPGTGAFAPAQLALADLNGDGNLDAVIGSLDGGAGIYLGKGEGTLTYKGALTNPVGLQNPLVIADVNGDGIPDVCLLEGNTVGVFLGNRNGTFEAQLGFGAGPAPGFILTENLHGQLPAAGLPAWRRMPPAE